MKASSGRLNSWKEIAAFLACGERTVQRYAQNLGLPVHHMGGAGQHRVYAFEAELQRWLERTGIAAHTREGTNETAPELSRNGGDDAQRPFLRLLVARGPEMGRTFSVRSLPADIGRDPQADVTIPFPQVSRRHARIFQDADGTLQVQDLCSRNGTRLDDREVNDACPLTDGARLCLGKHVVLKVDLLQQEETIADD